MNSEYLTILGMMAVTFLARYPVLAFVSKIKLPTIILKGLKFVPAAVLTAIIIPAILLDDQQIDISIHNSFLIASIIAGLTAWKSKNLLLTIIVGMSSFWVWKYILLN